MTAAADVAEVVFYVEDSTPPLTVTKPAAFGPDEMLVAVLFQDGSTLGSLTAPSGWVVPSGTTSVSITNMRAKVWVHSYTATDPATWDFGYDGTSAVNLHLYRITRGDLTPTVLVEATGIASSTASMDSPSITPASFDDLLLSSMAIFCNGTHLQATTPSGMTDQGQAIHPTNGISSAAASEQLPSSSPTGVRTWTSCAPTGEAAALFSIAVRTSPDPPPDLYLPGAMLPPPLLWELVGRQRRLEAGVIDTPKIPARTDLLCQITGATGNFGTGNWTTSSFTPPANSLVVVIAEVNLNEGPTTDPLSAFTISDSGGHTWTAVPGAAITSDPTNFPCSTKTFTAPFTTSGSVTLTVTTGGRSAGQYAVSVVAYTGYDTTTPIGAVATGESPAISSGAPPLPATITLNAAPATSSEVMAGLGADRTTAGVTQGDGWLEGCDTENTDWGGLQSQFRNDSPSTAVSWVDIRAGGVLFKYAAVAVEIRAAPVDLPPAAPAFPFTAPRSAFAWRGILPRRPRAAIAAPPQVVVTPPAYVALAVRGRLRYYTAKRFRAAVVVPAQQTPAAPTFIPSPTRSRVKALFATRHRAATAVPAQAAPPAASRPRARLFKPWRPRPATPVPPQAVPPLTAGRSRLRLLKAWKPRATTPVLPQAAPPPAAGRPRLRFWQVWRGRNVTPVPAQVVATPPTYPPASTRLRVRFWQAWRGHSVTPVPPQIVVTPPAYPPAGIRSRLRFWKPWRARTATPVPAQVGVAPPAYPPNPTRQRARAVRTVRGRQSSGPPPVQAAPPIQRRWRTTAGKAAPARRPRIVTPPATQAAPPLITRIRLRLARIVRGKTRQPTPAQIILIAPPYPPQSTRARRQMFAARRHRLTSDGWMATAVHSCSTARPNTGTTGRPSTGLTVYALGVTTRPGSGTTTRPNTGITEDPC